MKFTGMKAMKWQQFILAFIATLCLLFAGSALAQTDIQINDANLIRFGGGITVPEGKTVENALAFGGSVTVSPNAKVVDTAIAFGGNVTVQKGAQVEGDAYSFGGKVVQEPGAIIRGANATFSDRHGMMQGSHHGRSSRLVNYYFSTLFKISAAVVAAILGLIVLRTNSQFLPNLATELRQHSGLTALWGLGAIISFAFACMFLAITLIGIPLIPLLILTVMITTLVGSLGVALFVGQRLVRENNGSVEKQFLLGLAALSVLTLIPVLGGLVVFLVNLFGLGVILLWQFGKNEPRTAHE
jgi:hypothetical protein